MSAPQNIEPEEGSPKVAESDGAPDPQSRTEPPSKSEAIKRALAAGFEGAQEGTEYILKEFRIAIAPSQFSAGKATERKKSWTKNGKPGRKLKQAAQSDPARAVAGEQR